MKSEKTYSVVDLLDAKWCEGSDLYKNETAFELAKALLDVQSKARAVEHVAEVNAESGRPNVHATCVSEWMLEIQAIVDAVISKATK